MAGHPGLLDPGGPPTHSDDPSYRSWCELQADWLEPYVEYLTIRTLLGGRPWPEWEPALRHRDPRRVAEALADAPCAGRAAACGSSGGSPSSGETLRTYAADRGVLLYGDLPIFVAHDSADVWAPRDLFRLDASGTADDRDRRTARLLRRGRAALGQPALRLGRDGRGRLRLVAPADRAATRAVRPRTDRPLPRLRGRVARAGRRSDRQGRVVGAGPRPRPARPVWSTPPAPARWSPRISASSRRPWSGCGARPGCRG